MTDHPSIQILENYNQRRLEGVELLGLDDHLTGCAECRAKLRRMNPRSGAFFALRANLQTSREGAPEHLLREKLLAYVGGRLNEVDRELADSHLEVCPQCAAQARELGEFAAGKETLSTAAAIEPTRSGFEAGLRAALSMRSAEGRSASFPMIFRTAIAVIIALLLITTIVVWRRSIRPRQQVADFPSAPSPSPSLIPSDSSPGQRSADPAPILLVLHDGQERITIDAQGNIAGLESLSQADQQRVKSALETRKIQTPAVLRELRGSSGSMMGGPSKTAFALLAPIGEVIANDRPTFRWRPAKAAISYQVIITDPSAGYKKIAVSPQLQDTHWTIDIPLERGRIYAWQVIARTGDGEQRAPGESEPEAKFKTAEQSTIDLLARAKKIYAGRPLVLGLLYAEAGLLEEAERQLQMLVAANPQSPIAKSFQRDLRPR